MRMSDDGSMVQKKTENAWLPIVYVGEGRRDSWRVNNFGHLALPRRFECEVAAEIRKVQRRALPHQSPTGRRGNQGKVGALSVDVLMMN